MTEKELNKYYWLKKEIEDIENRLIEFGDGVSGIQYKEINVVSSHKVISIQDKRMELVNKLLEARVSALEEYIKIESFIETIDDSKIRQIMRYRFLDLKDWYRIGELMNCDRTTASKMLRKYLKEKISHNSHENVR